MNAEQTRRHRSIAPAGQALAGLQRRRAAADADAEADADGTVRPLPPHRIGGAGPRTASHRHLIRTQRSDPQTLQTPGRWPARDPIPHPMPEQIEDPRP